MRSVNTVMLGNGLLVQPSLAQTVAMVCIKLKMTLRVLLVNIVQPEKRSSPKVNFALTVMLENTRPKTLKQVSYANSAPLENTSR